MIELPVLRRKDFAIAILKRIAALIKTRGLASNHDFSHHRGAAIGLIVAATLLTFAALTVGSYLPPERGEVGVVFPPWTSQAEALGAVVAAGGKIAGVGRFANIVVAYALDDAFAQRVTQRGALFVAAAKGLCGPIEEVLI
ncbi:MAG TPA: hypothetical protein VL133_11050 [Devosia sp.]|nr:hypothetical protein [Devosia sp.]